MVENITEKEYTNFFTFLFLNLDKSINIVHRLFKLSEVIPDIIMEGTVSQIS